jgi:hypothetical protein
MKFPICMLALLTTIHPWLVAAESPRQATPLTHWMFAEDRSPKEIGAHAPPADWKLVNIPGQTLDDIVLPRA